MLRATLVGVRCPTPRSRNWSMALAVVLLAACGDDAPTSDAERFCGEAAASRELIVDPPLANETELAATLEFYRLMGQLAPLDIAAQWNELVVAIETASTVVPGDAASEQRAAITAYASEGDAYEVAVWMRRHCGVDLPIVTIAPQDPAPARTTTIAPPSTTTA